jgi:hypothetical protein
MYLPPVYTVFFLFDQHGGSLKTPEPGSRPMDASSTVADPAGSPQFGHIWGLYV